jgi:hypothetical protein
LSKGKEKKKILIPVTIHSFNRITTTTTTTMSTSGFGIPITKEDIDILRIVADSVEYTFQDANETEITKKLDFSLKELPNEMFFRDAEEITLTIKLANDIKVIGTPDKTVKITLGDFSDCDMQFGFNYYPNQIRFEKVHSTWMLAVSTLTINEEEEEETVDIEVMERFIDLVHQLAKVDRLGLEEKADDREEDTTKRSKKDEKNKWAPTYPRERMGSYKQFSLILDAE